MKVEIVITGDKIYSPYVVKKQDHSTVRHNKLPATHNY